MKVGDILTRGSTKWELVSQGDDGRWWCRSANRNTAWITFTTEPEGQTTPDDSPVCICFDYGDGFTNDPETGLYVHALCGKPTREHLEGMARRQGAWS